MIEAEDLMHQTDFTGEPLTRIPDHVRASGTGIIFNEKNDDKNEEMNLQTVLLLNPKNDEAIYMLTLLKIKQSNYNEAEELIEKFILVCKNLCSKKKYYCL